MVIAMIEHWGTQYMVTLKLGHFRQLSSPYEVIEFGSEWGKEMCVAVGVWGVGEKERAQILQLAQSQATR